MARNKKYIEATKHLTKRVPASQLTKCHEIIDEYLTPFADTVKDKLKVKSTQPKRSQEKTLQEELIWLERVKKYMNDFKKDHVITWWLRLEYEHEGISTSKINSILTRMAKRGFFIKETTRSYTKFTFPK